MPKIKAQEVPDTPQAVIYARYSSHNQTEQSIEGQLHDAYAFADREGYQVVGEYIDRALTGTKDLRPDFQRMVKDAEKRQFQTVIVWKLDRFARNRYDSAIYKARLRKCGVRVISVMESITDSPEGIILEGMLESMAEYYSANLAENVCRGQNENIKKGWYCGGNIPYGYTLRDHRLVADERTAPIVREIYARYAAGDSQADIIRDLNARGIRTAKGAAFRQSTLDNMIPNETYIGRYTYRGQLVPGLAEPIIEAQIFQRAMLRREANRRAPAAGKAHARYLLQGKAFCGMCGARMCGESGRSHTGAKHYYYACSNKKNHRTCKKKNERKGFAEWYVCEQTVRWILDPERMNDVAAAVVAEYDKEFSTGQTDALERTVRRLEADLNALVDSLITMPASARPRIAARMEQLEAQRADAQADLAKLRIAQGIRLTQADVVAWLRKFTAGDLMDEDYRQKIIDVLVNSVYFYDDRIVILYNVKGAKQVCVMDVISALDEMLPSAPSPGSDLAAVALPNTDKSEPRYIFVCGLFGVVIER